MIVATKFALLSLVSAALHLPITKVYNDPHSPLARRAAYADVLTGNGLSFYAELEVGTPPQKQSVIVDTGSSDLWFTTPQTCNTDANGNAPPNQEIISCDNTYDITKSSSFVNGTIPFDISYADKSGSYGYYAQDTITIGGATIEGANIAYANSASAPSIMGIGYANNEACVRLKFKEGDNTTIVVSEDRGCKPYDNIPRQLKAQGKIASTAYSIWLNDLSNLKGNILFGGVDHAKYLGQLVTLPMERSPYRYTYPPPNGVPMAHYEDFNVIQVTLNQVKIIADSGASEVLLSGAVPVVLDTGSTECSLPTILLKSLAQALDVVYEDGGFYVNCGVTDKVYIALNFRGLEIQVPLRQFLRPDSEYDGSYDAFGDDGAKYCRLGGSVEDEAATMLLGDNVLSSFYAVIDLERNEVALAPALFNQYETDVEDIVDSIPRAVQAPAYSQSFSSHLIINPSPTLDLGVTRVTSVYGITGPFNSYPNSDGLNGFEHYATADGVKAQRVPIVENNNSPRNGKAVTNATTAEPSSTFEYSYGITNIIETGVPTGLPDGIDSVYSAGAPSTLFLSSSLNGTERASSSSYANATSSSGYTNGTATVTGSGSSSDAAGYATTVTSDVTVLTTYCPEPTTFTWGHSTVVVTEATTLTITSCPAEDDVQTSHVDDNGPGPVIKSVATDTEVTTVFTTFCPEPTTFTYGHSTYIITEATTVTITSCPPDSETAVVQSTPVGETSAHGTPVPTKSTFNTTDTPNLPTEITVSDAPSTIASNNAVQASLCGALFLVALL